jgi:gluconolactonase
MTVVVDCLDKPNGLAFSPDESVLYVTDSGTNTVCAVEDGHPRVLFVPAAGAPDGIAVDAAGRVYACAADGVHVLDPDGQETEFIDLPGSINLTFGGPDNDRLFITADTAVHEVVLTREGA